MCFGHVLAYLARDVPKLKEEGDAAMGAYGDCILQSAPRTLGLVSSESAETVREAVFAACPKEREAIIDVHHRYHDGHINNEVMDRIDKKLASTVLLEIIKAHARSRSPDTAPNSSNSPARRPSAPGHIRLNLNGTRSVPAIAVASAAASCD
jgi:hypothetical protein